MIAKSQVLYFLYSLMLIYIADREFSQHYYYELYVAGQLYHAYLNNIASE